MPDNNTKTRIVPGLDYQDFLKNELTRRSDEMLTCLGVKQTHKQTWETSNASITGKRKKYE